MEIQEHRGLESGARAEDASSASEMLQCMRDGLYAFSARSAVRSLGALTC